MFLVVAHAEEAADRQHGKRLLSVCADEEIVDLADGFIGIVVTWLRFLTTT